MERSGDKAWSLLLACGVHLIAALLLLVGLQFSKPIELGGAAPLQAVMVDMNLLQSLPKPVPLPRPTPPAPPPEPVAAQAPPPAAEPAPQIIEDQAALRRQSELAAEQAAQAERLRIQAERERIEREKQREAERLKELEKVRAEREQAEAKRREEAQRLEAVRQQQAREVAERQAAEAAAAQAAAAQAARQADSLAHQYAALIQQVVTQNWRRPPNTPLGLRCTLVVRQIPGGEVIGVTIGRPCNATGAVQQSILDAVERASPLPYSGFERVFQRDLSFNFQYDG